MLEDYQLIIYEMVSHNIYLYLDYTINEKENNYTILEKIINRFLKKENNNNNFYIIRYNMNNNNTENRDFLLKQIKKCQNKENLIKNKILHIGYKNLLNKYIGYSKNKKIFKKDSFQTYNCNLFKIINDT